MTSAFTHSRLAPFAGQHILIIGGCGGIGYAIALASHDIGLHVTVMDLPQSIKSHDVPTNMNAINIDIRDEASIEAAFKARIPMGRLGHADDMVGPVLFLLSDSARYITGQVLHVNGGAFMRD